MKREEDPKLVVTPEVFYRNRRQFMRHGSLWGLGHVLLSRTGLAGLAGLATAEAYGAARKNAKFDGAGLSLTPEELATSYNNFYEFNLDKDVTPATKNWKLDPAAWKVEVTGAENARAFSVRELIEMGGGEEERVYRFRCVEAWSMVVPWTGFELGRLIAALKPKAGMKFVKFTTFGDAKIGPNIAKLPHYPWPYTEGLTLEEARHPLTLLATGLYGKPLPKQNGAPLRLVVPWKYGFKSIKSIVKIEFTATQPKTLWQELAPSEYGFYANVNPEVDHPRWSQATERVLSKSFFPKRQPTLLFNGYAKEVASLYTGLDLKKNY